jgi:GT2 family glycosyltransferase
MIIPVIGVFYNEIELVTDWLDCVLAQRTTEIEPIPIAVVNYCEQHTFSIMSKLGDFRKEKYSGLQILNLGTNTGHSHAFNRGVLLIAEHFPDCKWIGSLDPDARLEKTALHEMVTAATKADDRSGMVVPITIQKEKNDLCQAWQRSIGENNRETILHIGHYPEKIDLSELKSDEIVQHWRSHNFRETLNFPNVNYIKSFCPCFCASLWSVEMIGEIGLVDERQFRTLNCAEYGYRARLHGYTCVVANHALAFHPRDCTSSYKLEKFKIAVERVDTAWHYQHAQGLIALKYFPETQQACCKVNENGTEIQKSWVDLIDDLRHVRRYTGKSVGEMDNLYSDFIKGSY